VSACRQCLDALEHEADLARCDLTGCAQAIVDCSRDKRRARDVVAAVRGILADKVAAERIASNAYRAALAIDGTCEHAAKSAPTAGGAS
jgi:translation initiation factor 1 (eIF-1/SUI1)